MDLRSIANSVTGSINPNIIATIRQSTGYTTGADGAQIPTYQTRTAWIQVQALSNDELRQVDGLNIQGNKCGVYLHGGQWSGVVRVGRQGGDIFMFGGQTWLAAIVLENWKNWTKLALVLQNGS